MRAAGCEIERKALAIWRQYFAESAKVGCTIRDGMLEYSAVLL